MRRSPEGVKCAPGENLRVSKENFSKTDTKLRNELKIEGELARKVRAFLLSRCPESADDIRQEAMMRIWRFRHTYKCEDGASLQTWAIQIAIRVMLEYLREKNRREGPRGGTSNLEMLYGQPGAASPDDPSEKLQQFTDAADRVRRWYVELRENESETTRLKREQRWKAFQLRWGPVFGATTELRTREIAEELGMAAPDVSRAIYEVTARITKELNSKNEN